MVYSHAVGGCYRWLNDAVPSILSHYGEKEARKAQIIIIKVYDVGVIYATPLLWADRKQISSVLSENGTEETITNTSVRYLTIHATSTKLLLITLNVFSFLNNVLS